MTENTVHKGHVAELAVAYDLAERYGYTICHPLASAPFDLIAVRNNEAVRVQVKTVRRRERNGKTYIVIDCTDGRGRRYKKGVVDLFAAYDPLDGRVYYVRYEDLKGARERWIDPTKVYQL
jgi:hypothetical protein